MSERFDPRTPKGPDFQLPSVAVPTTEVVTVFVADEGFLSTKKPRTEQEYRNNARLAKLGVALGLFATGSLFALAGNANRDNANHELESAGYASAAGNTDRANEFRVAAAADQSRETFANIGVGIAGGFGVYYGAQAIAGGVKPKETPALSENQQAVVAGAGPDLKVTGQ